LTNSTQLSYKGEGSALYRVMATVRGGVDGLVDTAAFETFLATAEPRLRVALVATYGSVDGQAAAFDALSWAWEHWDRVQGMANPVGYLFRVAQTSVRKSLPRPVPFDHHQPHVDQPTLEPEMSVALARLSEQQRTVVLLVHAFGWTIREVAAVLGIAASTVQTHAERGLSRLRTILEETDER
jgi:DNA-directed RNA polymerase specialized sigma24 family protein